MTVKDLIEKLQAMPQDLLVVYDIHSETVPLEDEWPMVAADFIERNGIYMRFVERWWNKERDGEPKLVTVCHFPGN